MRGLGPHAPLLSRGKPPPSLAVVDALPSSSHFTRTTTLYPLRRRQKSGLSFARCTIRALASNISGVEPGDYGSSNEKDGHNVFEKNSVEDSSSKVITLTDFSYRLSLTNLLSVKPPTQIPYPLSIAFVLLGCAFVFSLIAFVKGGPSSILAAIAKSGFTAAFTLIFVSEIGDKTFFIAALLAMQFEKGLVLLGSMGALGLMSVLSVVIGRIFQSVPAQFQTTVPIGEYAAVTLLLFFGLKAIKDAWDLPSDVAKKGDNSSPELDELAEAEELVKEKVSKKLSNPLEIIWKSFSLVFFAEWGDRSMLATIALGAAQSPWGVASGAIAGHLVATTIAILGGAFLANYISEKLVGYLGGGLFLIFAVATFFGVF
ncbi:protein PAM71-homolog, chloroplastic isoform X2 [Vigna unguiculata]|uniref:protein PAM71-homolog, chloroplastic isoform X2 n=1 Tax=Vigna unguiculata TaxID=3917 RepID=UPI00101603FE|nr:protein PAM71-homolog, chloroplastic isoform X2 [Vigna unguiculata]